MRVRLTYAFAAVALALWGGCRRQDDTQPATAPAPAAPAATYGAYPAYQQQPPPPAYGQYPAPPPTATYAYPAPPPPAPAPAPAPTPPAPPAPAASGQMAVPGPVAFQCTNDVPCGTHHCNTQYGKCAFPCQSNVDCIAPNTCVLGLCVPAPPGQH